MAGQSGLIVITKSSAASADGTVTGDVPYLYEQLSSPKIEGETADEYDSRRLAKCQEALYTLYEGMLGKGGMFHGEPLEAFLEHQAAELIELPISRVVAHFASQCEVLTRLLYDQDLSAFRQFKRPLCICIAVILIFQDTPDPRRVDQ